MTIAGAQKWTVWSLLGVFVGGVLLGLVGALLQASEVTLGPVTIPLWMILVLAAMATTARAVTLHYESRKPAAAWFGGWLVTTLVLSTPLPSGDQIVSDGVVQMIYVFGGAVLGSAFVSLPARLGLAAAGTPGAQARTVESADEARQESTSSEPTDPTSSDSTDSTSSASAEPMSSELTDPMKEGRH